MRVMDVMPFLEINFLLSFFSRPIPLKNNEDDQIAWQDIKIL